MKNSQSGFTLIELVVVIIIVAVLAAASVPIYRNYVQRAMGAEASSVAGTIHSTLKAFWVERADLPATVASTNFSQALGIDLRNNRYFHSFNYTRGSANTYTATILGAGDAAGLSLVVESGSLTSTPPFVLNPSWD